MEFAGSLDVLTDIVGAAAGRIPILFDGGVRGGGDVLKALALGATACVLGRPQLWALSIAGEDGVVRLLDIFRQEIDRAMALCGLQDLAGVNSGLILHKCGFTRPAWSLSPQTTSLSS